MREGREGARGRQNEKHPTHVSLLGITINPSLYRLTVEIALSKVSVSIQTCADMIQTDDSWNVFATRSMLRDCDINVSLSRLHTFTWFHI